MFDVNELLEDAIKETENVNEGEIFLIKDLFKGYVWNRIAVKDRLLLGTLFLNYVHKTKENLLAIEKTASHQQQYKKVNNINTSDQNSTKMLREGMFTSTIT